MGIFGKKTYAVDILFFADLKRLDGGPPVSVIASCEKMGFMRSADFLTREEATIWMEEIIEGFGPETDVRLKVKTDTTFHFVAYVPAR